MAWMREPVVVFAVVGALTLAVWPAEEPRGRIVVPASVVAKGPGAEEAWVDEEVLFREGLALGLDRADPIVRRRIVQQVGFLFEDLEVGEPDEATLRAWHGRWPERWTGPETVAAQVVHLAGAPETLAARAAAARTRLAAGEDPARVGDPTPFGTTLGPQDADRWRAMLGAPATAAVMALPVGAWSEPIPTPTGLALVRVSARESASVLDFERVREEVAADWRRARREQARSEAMAGLRDRWQVVEAAP